MQVRCGVLCTVVYGVVPCVDSDLGAASSARGPHIKEYSKNNCAAIEWCEVGAVVVPIPELNGVRRGCVGLRISRSNAVFKLSGASGAK